MGVESELYARCIECTERWEDAGMCGYNQVSLDAGCRVLSARYKVEVVGLRMRVCGKQKQWTGEIVRRTSGDSGFRTRGENQDVRRPHNCATASHPMIVNLPRLRFF